MVKKLTLEDRRKIEQMWKDNAFFCIIFLSISGLEMGETR